MLSYRHAFHAGNHADVLKHCILVQLLRHLNLKEKPWWFVDTHAGAGRYRLDSEQALKNAEFEGGVKRLWTRGDAPPAVADYLAQVRLANTGGPLRVYPGSPLIALGLARPADRLRLFELHGADFRLLEKAFAEADPAGRRAALRLADGFAEIKSVLPPPPRRGLVLMDPAYEDKRDYLRVAAALKEGLVRFPTGIYAVWYPGIQRGDARQLPEKLKKLSAKGWLHAWLDVRAPTADGFGMHGSGMFVLNPPWTLADALTETLPWLADALGLDAGAGFLLEQGGTG